ncbi:MAG TPA: hypothetical protein VGO62_15885 [Myxococcota bacterium]
MNARIALGIVIGSVLVTAVAATPVPPSSLRVRAYVDEGYAKADVAPAKLKPIVAEASALLMAQIGVGLELADVKPWHPSPAAAKNLRAAQAEIEETDQADKNADVDVVLAFIGKSPLPGDEFHKLGSAHELGKEGVVRLVDDAHEQAVVLAHQVAHLLGAVHPTDAPFLTSASYNKEEKAFDDDNIALTKLGVVFHTAKSEVDRASAGAQLKRELDKRKAKLDPKSADDLKNAIDQAAGVASSDVVLPPDQAKIFNDAVVLMNNKNFAGAFAKLQPLADDPKAPAQVLYIACRIDANDGVNDKNAASHCERALKSSHDVDTANAAIRYAVHAHDNAAISRAFAEAKARLAASPGGTPDIDELAALAQGTARIGIAEDALAKSSAKNAADLKHELLINRRRSGVPRGMLKDDDEATVFNTMKAAEAIKDPGDATRAIDEAISHYGEVPGLLVERCDALRKRNKLRDAEVDCEKAVAKYDDASVGHFVAGLVYLTDELPAKAVPHLEKAIALDPDTPQTYELLDSAYHAVGNKDARKKLDAAFEAKFKKPLAPE